MAARIGVTLFSIMGAAHAAMRVCAYKLPNVRFGGLWRYVFTFDKFR